MNDNATRLAFLGTPDFATHILKALVNAHYNIVAVYTQPPRPVGRGYKLTPSPVQKYAEENNLPVLTPPSLKSEEEQQQWRDLNLDVAVVAAYGLILPKPILDAPAKGCINIHASLLPRWRGAAPIQRAILAGDQETGVTIMKMDKGLDTGDMLLTKKTPITPTTTTTDLLNRMAVLGAEAIIEALPLYLSGKVLPTPQPSEGVTYADKLEKHERHVDWRLPAAILDRKVRALNPWPGTWFDIAEDRIKVLKAEFIPESLPFPPGTIVDNKLTISCGEGALRLLSVQKVGKSPLSAEEFLRGYELPSRHLLDVAV